MQMLELRRKISQEQREIRELEREVERERGARQKGRRRKKEESTKGKSPRKK